MEGERLVTPLLQMPNEKRGDPMTETKPGRAHLIAGGFPPGSTAGHDHDYARLRPLGLLAGRAISPPAAQAFADVRKWPPVWRVPISLVARPPTDPPRCRAAQ